MAVRKLLIANRGEIAVRILRTARRLGWHTIAVYSEADRDALHVRLADEAVYLGGAAPEASYLDIERVLNAARATGAEAVHPGVGFLAENPDFAQACTEAGLLFVGPSAQTMILMGDKRAAKVAARQAGVPTLPGYDGDEQTIEHLLEQGRTLGFPLMVKAAAGGGGRGIRSVERADALEDALNAARREAEGAFGNGALLLERALERARHIEVQVFGDALGQAVSLGERDCSIQRRHQKVIEEAPAPSIDASLRQRLQEAAVVLTRAVGYVGAGTVEFLVEAEGDAFYFLEMNTRLQVEHPVTEAVTGLDLVEWQLEVALGKALPLAQDEITWAGHAMEARLYAEDPAQGFRPQTGPLRVWKPKREGAAVRIDSGFEQGDEISPFYDAMLAKIIVHGRDRDDALRRLTTALDHCVVLGIKHNRAFLKALCEHPVMVAGGATTAFLAEDFAGHATVEPAEASAEVFACAALIFYLDQSPASRQRIGWRTSSRPLPSTFKIRCSDAMRHVEVERQRSPLGVRFRIALEDAPEVNVTVLDWTDGRLVYVRADVRRTLAYALTGTTLELDLERGCVTLQNASGEAPPKPGFAPGSGVTVAQFAGRVTRVACAPGGRVEVGALLLIIEAMKMEQEIRSDVAGTVRAVHVEIDVQVKERQHLVEVEADDASRASAPGDES